MEANDMKAMREALSVFIHDFASFREDMAHGRLHMMQCMDFVKQYIPLMESALSAPARNCDVGTAEEQVGRFKEYCQSHMQYYRDMFGTHEGAGGWDCREDCPVGKMVDKNDSFCDHCELVWAQMPYEKEGEEQKDE